jgi:hypothetical protein
MEEYLRNNKAELETVCIINRDLLISRKSEERIHTTIWLDVISRRRRVRIPDMGQGWEGDFLLYDIKRFGVWIK